MKRLFYFRFWKKGQVMHTRIQMAFLICIFVMGTVSADEPVQFERLKIADTAYEAASAFDVDRDQHIDIVSGEYWFAGPDFKKRYKICDVQKAGEYYDDFSDYPMDVDGDGYLDIVTGGFWGNTLRWRQNPKGRGKEWKVHIIAETGPVETTRFWDVDGDGYPEAVPNAGGKVVVYKLVRDAAGRGTGEFTAHPIKESGCGHGLGFGDINGDGRGDFVIPAGWIEAPAGDVFAKQWTFHPEFQLGTASVPILVYDVDEDGLSDLIVGEAHNYGLYWLQQKQQDGRRRWIKHDIERHRSQYHDMQLVDVDNDGRAELVTGKRYRAHCGHDPGADEPVGTYYFEINKGAFQRITIDFGPATKASGVGIYFWVDDITGNGYKDILAPGKEGLYLFKNSGSTRAAR